MCITARDLEALRPVRRAGRVAYPTREQAGALGIDLFRLPESYLSRSLRGGVTGATLLALAAAGCGLRDGNVSGALQIEDPGSAFYEAQARVVAESRFSEQGIVLEQDYQYTSGGIDCNLDGFSPSRRIGYDYHSYEDHQESLTAGGTPQWDEKYCDDEEWAAIEAMGEGGGDAIKIIRLQHLHTSDEESEYLESQLTEFMDWLRSTGRI